MKRKKTLLTFFVVIVLLSIISVVSYKSKNNDFLIAISSLANDFIVIISFITIIYSLITYSIYIREELFSNGKFYHKYMAISLIMLMITMTMVFLAYATIFSHRNIFSYLIDTLVRNKNIDILKILVKAILIYHYIFLSTVNSILLNYKWIKMNNIIILPILIIFILALLFLIIYLVYNNLFLIIFIFNIILFFIGYLFWKQKN